jgi:hypothetical protein
MAKIRGTEGMSASQLNFELQRGGRFVIFQYCMSVIILTFKRSSDVYFIRSGESAVSKSIPFTLVTLVAGWWGIPWGPIFSVQALANNFKGGKDVTKEVVASFNRPAAAPQAQARPVPVS